MSWFFILIFEESLWFGEGGKEGGRVVGVSLRGDVGIRWAWLKGLISCG